MDFHERFESGDCGVNTTDTKRYGLPDPSSIASFETKIVSANCGSNIVSSKLDGNCLSVTYNLRGCGYDNLLIAKTVADGVG
jgi:hypothetical protein